MDDRMPRRLRSAPGLLALLTVLVLSGAACGGERAGEQGSQEPNTKTTIAETTAAETMEKTASSYCSSGSTQYGFVDLIQPLKGGSGMKADGRVRIGGWAATPAGSPPVERVEVRVEGQAVEPVSECMAREDLAKAFGKDARYGGWEVTVDLRDIEITGPTVDVSAEAIDRDGGRHPLPKAGQAESKSLPAP